MSCSNTKRIKPYLFLICFSFINNVNIFAQQPNIIYIMSDDMGYGDLSGYGRKDYSTPNLDKLASQGMKFINAYSAGAVCTPTRTAFMTGRYPAKSPVGLFEPLRPRKLDSAYGLTPDIPSIATLLKSSGYETILIGKWHLGYLPQHSPVRNGFDYFFGFHTGTADYISHKGASRRHDLYENESLVYPQGYLTDIFSQKAIDFIKQKHNKPFFLALTFNAPHFPWQGPTDNPYEDTVAFSKGGSPKTYAEMMKSLDDGIGNIMKTLDSERLSGQTIIIFTNDNGGERFSDNGGLAKGKGSLWEGGIRVPAFVRWPGKITAGTITPQVAITMDWTATILSVANAKTHTEFPLDGIDLLPLLTGRIKNIERTIYWRTSQFDKQKAIRDGKWKYLQDQKGEYLFDLSSDKEEKKDVKIEQQAIFSSLKEKYSQWEKTVLQPIDR